MCGVKGVHLFRTMLNMVVKATHDKLLLAILIIVIVYLICIIYLFAKMWTTSAMPFANIYANMCECVHTSVNFA